MVAEFMRWWIAQMRELLPAAWLRSVRGWDGIVIDAEKNLAAAVRVRGRTRPISLREISRVAARRPVILRPPPGALLVKRHVVPTVPRRELPELLHHELARITPFKAEELFWAWDGRVDARDRTLTNVTLTMVPKPAVAAVLAALDSMDIRPDFLEVGPAHHPAMLPVWNRRQSGTVVVRVMKYGCAGLAVVALLLPALLQALTMYRIDRKLDELQPMIKLATTLRQTLTASGAAEGFLDQEAERYGELLRVLATVTNILPDDTFLTDLSLRERQLSLNGRTASAPRLITNLAATSAIREPTFAAPVTRVDGTSMDAFHIKARLGD